MNAGMNMGMNVGINMAMDTGIHTVMGMATTVWHRDFWRRRWGRRCFWL